jgi:hypothetical protein
MVQWLLSANGRRLAVLAALGALTACATPSARPSDATPGSGWQVVERVGQARHSPPDAAGWLAAITGRPIVDGSQVETGRGGRLILAMPGRHISVGPGSRFALPRHHGGDRLEQRAGWLRYRVANAGAEPFRVRTPSLDLEFVAAILDVRVEQEAVDVTVREGEVRLATPDGLRRTEIAAGQSARASGLRDTQLAVRRAPDGAPETVDSLVVPAIQPAPAAARAPDSEATPRAKGPAEPLAAVPPAVPEPSDHRGPLAPHRPGAIGLARGAAVPGAHEGAQPAVHPLGTAEASPKMLAARDQGQPAGAAPAVGHSDFSTERRAKLERLTEGMLDGLRPPPPTWVQP